MPEQYENIEILETINVSGEDEVKVLERLNYPLKDGIKAERNATVFCIIDGEVKEGTVLGYVRLKMEAEKGESSTYQFYLPAHKVRLVGGQEVNAPMIFSSKKDAEKHLEKTKSGISNVYKIERIDVEIDPLPEEPPIKESPPIR